MQYGKHIQPDDADRDRGPVVSKQHGLPPEPGVGLPPVARRPNPVTERSPMRSDNFTHPLTDFAMAQFNDKHKVHDATTLAMAMGAATNPVSAFKACKTVATDILSVMKLNGHLVQDAAGWYRPVGDLGGEV